MLTGCVAIAAAGLVAMSVAPAHGAATGASAAPVRDSYATDGSSISIVGHPRVSTTGDEVEVRVRYRCVRANDVQIKVRVSNPTNAYANNFGRFGYPTVSAVCDDAVHLVAVVVGPYPPAGVPPTLRAGAIVRVGVDLVDYGPLPADAPIGVQIPLAGDLLADVRLGPRR